MKSYNFFKQRIENLLLKRYAFNYLFAEENKILLLLFTLFNFLLFSFFWSDYICELGCNQIFNQFYLLFILLTICLFLILSKIISIVRKSLINKKENSNSKFTKNFKDNLFNSLEEANKLKNYWWQILIVISIYIISSMMLGFEFMTISGILISMIYIFLSIMKYIPKFLWIGVLGWILLTAEIIPGMFDYSITNKTVESNQQIFTSNLSFDVSKFLGDRIQYHDNALIQTTSIVDFLKISIKSVFSLSCMSNFLIGLLIIFLLAIYFIPFSSGELYSYKIRKIVTKTAIAIAILILIFLFYKSGIYFIPLSLGLFVVNTAIVYWEINDRGRNPEPFLRALNFTTISQLLTANIGMLIFIAISPLFQGVQLTIENYLTFLWIIIAGSGLSVFMALISQIIWSGKRLTEKYG